MRSILIAATMVLAGAAAAQQPDLSQSGLVGKLENPAIVADPAQWPKTFNEAPELAALGIIWTAIMTVASTVFFVVSRRYGLSAR